MNRIYRKIKRNCMIASLLFLFFLTGCTEQKTEEIYQLGNREVQIDLSSDFACTEQNSREIIMNGEAGKIKMEYLESAGTASSSFPKSEQECIGLFETIIGDTSYQVEEFRSYEEEGVYHATIRYDLENEVKYLIASGIFDGESGCQISASLNTGDREAAQEIQNAVYNVKIFAE